MLTVRVHGCQKMSTTNTGVILDTRVPLSSARQHPSYGDCLEVKGILSELLRAGLCDTMFTVSSTLM